MLNWTDDDRPYVEALRALEAASYELILQEQRTTGYQGPRVWDNLRKIGRALRVAWVADRLARLRNSTVRAR